VSIWRRTETRALPTSIDPYQISARPAVSNWSGEIVDEISALASSTVLACVSLIADSVATMTLEVVEERGSRQIVIEKPSLFERPNEYQTMFEFIHQSCVLIATLGGDYIYAPRTGAGLPNELLNFSPRRVNPKMTKEGDLLYNIGKQSFTRQDIIPVYWMMLPEHLRPISPVEAQRNIVGMNLAMDRFLAQFYGEGATPSSVFETDQPMTKDTAEVLRETWEDTHWKRRRPAVLANGLKWRSITTSAADMQMLEHRESIVRDIARVYRVPLHLISGTGGDSQTYQNVESSGINFVRHTLLPYMRRLEDALSELLPSGQRVRFNANELLRGDLMTRVRAQQVQIASGTLTPNEARAIENREPYDGGDQFVLNLPGAPMANVAGGDAPTLGIDKEPPQ
jgi:HK97 family phage portal protein